MSVPSWDLKYLETIERRLRLLESKMDELEKAIDAARMPAEKSSEPSSTKRRRQTCPR